MKRVVCLLLVVSIACAGCYDTEIDPISGRPIIHVQPEDQMAEPVSGPKVPKLVSEPIKLKAMAKQIEALRVRIDELEAEIESQREEFENSKNVYRLYEVAIESQKVAIESLEKLCRMYEAEIESQGKSRSSEESPLGKEPDTHQ